MIVTLLKELGIPSTLVIVRTQLRGDFPSDLPGFAPYDHAIAYVPSLDLYLDGTAEFAGASELPLLDRGALAIQVNQGDAKRVVMPDGDPATDVIERRVEAKLQADGSARLTLEYETRGVAAADWRSRYHAEATRRDRVSQDLGRQLPGFSITAGPTGITTNDLGDLEQPVKLKIRGVAAGFARREGNQLSMAATTGLRLAPEYASLARRTQDLRILGFSTRRDTFEIALPKGAKVRATPPDVSVTSEFGSYSVKVELHPGRVIVRSELSLKVSRIKPADYAAWKRFCVKADLALSPRLVVEP